MSMLPPLHVFPWMRMILNDVWELFERHIFSAPSSATLFNPYNSRDPNHDRPGAEVIRRQNLQNYLHSFARRPSLMVVGEAPGWRGCRFSGVPFTSEAQLAGQFLPFGGRQSSRRITPYRESSATLFWGQLRPYHSLLFAWNAVPFHPHPERKPMSNRGPSGGEIKEHAAFLWELASMLEPRQIAAVGRSAERALSLINLPCTYIRHPSHGGGGKFGAEMRALILSLTQSPCAG